MSLVENLLKKMVLEKAIIDKKEKISNIVYKVRIKSEGIKKQDFQPGYFIRLGIGIGNDELSMKDKVRSYSVWDINKTEGYLDLAISTESHGIGSQWVENCKVGETVYFKWKKGHFLLDNSADSYLMIGDLSALSHLYIINRNLPKSKQVESLIYSQDSNNFFEDINGKKLFKFYQLEENDIDKIFTIVEELVAKMKGNKMVYIAGDSRICVDLNHYFRKILHWNSKQIKIKPFWNPEKKGLE